MRKGFSLLASCYDRFNGARYEEYLGFFEKALERFSAVPVEDVLDLGCGTGCLTRLLCGAGYGLVGLDGSADMLARAARRCEGMNALFLQQDMRAFELYGTVQATVCSFDSLNYLLNVKELSDCFSLVNNYTQRGGLFVFDLNTRYRYERVLDGASFVFEDGEALLIWRNSYSARSGLCELQISLFEREGGLWRREDEAQRQRCYAPGTVRRLLAANGFELCGLFGGTDMRPLEPDSEKAYFVARSARGRAQG